jgi:hypothetical protein
MSLFPLNWNSEQDIYFIQKRHELTKRAAVNALLRLPLVYFHVYLKSVLRQFFKFLCLSSRREQGCNDPWLFIETKKDPRAKESGKRWTTRVSKTWR